MVQEMSGLRFCGLMVGVLLAAPALADDAPLLLPTRDVQVTYKVLGRGAGKDVKISQRARSTVMRIEGAGRPGYLLVDRATQRATAVQEAQGYFTDLPANRVPQEGQLPDDKISFKRLADDNIAGVGCTNWDYVTSRGNGTACITGDGVMLRSLALSGNGLEATTVA